jgi:hypothetical protein
LILASCVLLFHLANAAMLPLVGSILTTRSSDWATVLIAACIVAPQIIGPVTGDAAMHILSIGSAGMIGRGLTARRHNDGVFGDFGAPPSEALRAQYVARDAQASAA